MIKDIKIHFLIIVSLVSAIQSNSTVVSKCNYLEDLFYIGPTNVHSHANHGSLQIAGADQYRTCIFELCAGQFEGPWRQTTSAEFEFVEFESSIRDAKFYCGLPVQLRSNLTDYDISEAVVRLYSPQIRNITGLESNIETISRYLDDEAKYSVIKLTPRVYVYFNGGRIEQFMPTGQLRLDDSDLSSAGHVFRTLALLNQLTPPANRTTDKFWTFIELLISRIYSCQQLGQMTLFSKPTQTTVRPFFAFNFAEELNFLRYTLQLDTIPTVYSPLTVDQHELLFVKVRGHRSHQETEHVLLTDASLGFYNYRTYDLATYLNSFKETFKSNGQYPHFEALDRSMSKEQIHQLLIEYGTSLTRKPASELDIDLLLDELSRTTLIAHLISALMAMDAAFNNIGKKVGFPELAAYRLDRYKLEKTAFFKSRLTSSIPKRSKLVQYFIVNGGAAFPKLTERSPVLTDHLTSGQTVPTTPSARLMKPYVVQIVPQIPPLLPVSTERLQILTYGDFLGMTTPLDFNPHHTNLFRTNNLAAKSEMPTQILVRQDDTKQKTTGERHHVHQIGTTLGVADNHIHPVNAVGSLNSSSISASGNQLNGPDEPKYSEDVQTKINSTNVDSVEFESEIKSITQTRLVSVVMPVNEADNHPTNVHAVAVSGNVYSAQYSTQPSSIQSLKLSPDNHHNHGVKVKLHPNSNSNQNHTEAYSYSYPRKENGTNVIQAIRTKPIWKKFHSIVRPTIPQSVKSAVDQTKYPYVVRSYKRSNRHLNRIHIHDKSNSGRNKHHDERLSDDELSVNSNVKSRTDPITLRRAIESKLQSSAGESEKHPDVDLNEVLIETDSTKLNSNPYLEPFPVESGNRSVGGINDAFEVHILGQKHASLPDTRNSQAVYPVNESEYKSIVKPLEFYPDADLSQDRLDTQPTSDSNLVRPDLQYSVVQVGTPLDSRPTEGREMQRPENQIDVINGVESTRYISATLPKKWHKHQRNINPPVVNSGPSSRSVPTMNRINKVQYGVGAVVQPQPYREENIDTTNHPAIRQFNAELVSGLATLPKKRQKLRRNINSSVGSYSRSVPSKNRFNKSPIAIEAGVQPYIRRHIHDTPISFVQLGASKDIQPDGPTKAIPFPQQTLSPIPSLFDVRSESQPYSELSVDTTNRPAIRQFKAEPVSGLDEGNSNSGQSVAQASNQPNNGSTEDQGVLVPESQVRVLNDVKSQRDTTIRIPVKPRKQRQSIVSHAVSNNSGSPLILSRKRVKGRGTIEADTQPYRHRQDFKKVSNIKHNVQVGALRGFRPSKVSTNQFLKPKSSTRTDSSEDKSENQPNSWQSQSKTDNTGYRPSDAEPVNHQNEAISNSDLSDSQASIQPIIGPIDVHDLSIADKRHFVLNDADPTRNPTTAILVKQPQTIDLSDVSSNTGSASVPSRNRVNNATEYDIQTRSRQNVIQDLPHNESDIVLDFLRTTQPNDVSNTNNPVIQSGLSPMVDPLSQRRSQINVDENIDDPNHSVIRQAENNFAAEAHSNPGFLRTQVNIKHRNRTPDDELIALNDATGSAKFDNMDNSAPSELPTIADKPDAHSNMTSHRYPSELQREVKTVQTVMSPEERNHRSESNCDIEIRRIQAATEALDELNGTTTIVVPNLEPNGEPNSNSSPNEHNQNQAVMQSVTVRSIGSNVEISNPNNSVDEFPIQATTNPTDAHNTRAIDISLNVTYGQRKEDSDAGDLIADERSLASKGWIQPYTKLDKNRTVLNSGETTEGEAGSTVTPSSKDELDNETKTRTVNMPAGQGTLANSIVATNKAERNEEPNSESSLNDSNVRSTKPDQFADHLSDQPSGEQTDVHDTRTTGMPTYRHHDVQPSKNSIAGNPTKDLRTLFSSDWIEVKPYNQYDKYNSGLNPEENKETLIITTVIPISKAEFDYEAETRIRRIPKKSKIELDHPSAGTETKADLEPNQGVGLHPDAQLIRAAELVESNEDLSTVQPGNRSKIDTGKVLLEYKDNQLDYFQAINYERYFTAIYPTVSPKTDDGQTENLNIVSTVSSILSPKLGNEQDETSNTVDPTVSSILSPKLGNEQDETLNTVEPTLSSILSPKLGNEQDETSNTVYPTVSSILSPKLGNEQDETLNTVEPTLSSILSPKLGNEQDETSNTVDPTASSILSQKLGNEQDKTLNTVDSTVSSILSPKLGNEQDETSNTVDSTVSFTVSQNLGNEQDGTSGTVDSTVSSNVSPKIGNEQDETMNTVDSTVSSIVSPKRGNEQNEAPNTFDPIVSSIVTSKLVTDEIGNSNVVDPILSSIVSSEPLTDQLGNTNITDPIVSSIVPPKLSTEELGNSKIVDPIVSSIVSSEPLTDQLGNSKITDPIVSSIVSPKLLTDESGNSNVVDPIVSSIVSSNLVTDGIENSNIVNKIVSSIVSSKLVTDEIGNSNVVDPILSSIVSSEPLTDQLGNTNITDPIVSSIVPPKLATDELGNSRIVDPIVSSIVTSKLVTEKIGNSNIVDPIVSSIVSSEPLTDKLENSNIVDPIVSSIVSSKLVTDEIGNSNIVDPIVSSIVSSEPLTDQLGNSKIVDPIISSMVSPKLATEELGNSNIVDPVVSSIVSSEPLTDQLKNSKIVDPIISSIVSSEPLTDKLENSNIVDPIVSSIVSSKLVTDEIGKSNIVDPIISSIVSPKLATEELGNSKIVDSIVSSLVSSKLVTDEIGNSNIVDPIVSSIVSSEPLTDQLGNSKIVDPIISSIVSPKLSTEELGNSNIVDPIVSSIVSSEPLTDQLKNSKIVGPIISSMVSPKLATEELGNSNIVDPIVSSIVSSEPLTDQLRNSKIVGPIISSFVSPKLSTEELGNSKIVGPIISSIVSPKLSTEELGNSNIVDSIVSSIVSSKLVTDEIGNSNIVNPIVYSIVSSEPLTDKLENSNIVDPIVSSIVSSEPLTDQLRNSKIVGPIISSIVSPKLSTEELGNSNIVDPIVSFIVSSKLVTDEIGNSNIVDSIVSSIVSSKLVTDEIGNSNVVDPIISSIVSSEPLTDKLENSNIVDPMLPSIVPPKLLDEQIGNLNITDTVVPPIVIPKDAIEQFENSDIIDPASIASSMLSYTGNNMTPSLINSNSNLTRVLTDPQNNDVSRDFQNVLIPDKLGVFSDNLLTRYSSANHLNEDINLSPITDSIVQPSIKTDRSSSEQLGDKIVEPEQSSEMPISKIDYDYVIENRTIPSRIESLGRTLARISAETDGQPDKFPIEILPSNLSPITNANVQSLVKADKSLSDQLGDKIVGPELTSEMPISKIDYDYVIEQNRTIPSRIESLGRTLARISAETDGQPDRFPIEIVPNAIQFIQRDALPDDQSYIQPETYPHQYHKGHMSNESTSYPLIEASLLPKLAEPEVLKVATEVEPSSQGTDTLKLMRYLSASRAALAKSSGVPVVQMPKRIFEPSEMAGERTAEYMLAKEQPYRTIGVGEVVQ